MCAAEKACFKCLRNLPLEAFYKHKAMADGHLNKCKECTKKDVAEHRQANLEKLRAYDKMRAHKPHRVALRQSVTAEYAKQFPNRRKANQAVSWALRDKQIEKLPCQVCGDSKSVGHHPDYDRPLDVVWLCQKHHKQAHALVA